MPTPASSLVHKLSCKVSRVWGISLHCAADGCKEILAQCLHSECDSFLTGAEALHRISLHDVAKHLSWNIHLFPCRSCLPATFRNLLSPPGHNSRTLAFKHEIAGHSKSCLGSDLVLTGAATLFGQASFEFPLMLRASDFSRFQEAVPSVFSSVIQGCGA